MGWLADLQLIQIVVLLLLIAVAPCYEVWRMRRRLRAADARAAAAEAQLQRALGELSAVQREVFQREAVGRHPLRTPPDFAAVLDEIDAGHPTDPYILPAGWVKVNGEPDLATLSLHGESLYFCGHGLVTGETGGGKDGWLFQATAALCSRATPAQLQLFYIDGKGPDGALWRGKRHNWREPVTEAAAIPAAIESLETERARRMRAIEAAGVTKWEELPALTRPPLLWIVVSELKLLKKALGAEFETWLESELVSARAAGMRYCVATQTATNMRMEWRSQIGFYVAGWQSSRDADKPNIQLSTDELRERGAIPPSELPAPGYFTVRVKRDVVTVRATYLDLAGRKAVLAKLPAQPAVLPSPSTSSAPSTSVEGPFSALESAGSESPSATTTVAQVAETGSGPTGRSAPSAVTASVPATLTVGGKPDEPSYEERARLLLAERREAVIGAIQAGKSDYKIMETVFNVTGGRLYTSLKAQVAALRGEVQTPVATTA